MTDPPNKEAKHEGSNSGEAGKRKSRRSKVGATPLSQENSPEEEEQEERRMYPPYNPYMMPYPMPMQQGGDSFKDHYKMMRSIWKEFETKERKKQEEEKKKKDSANKPTTFSGAQVTLMLLALSPIVGPIITLLWKASFTFLLSALQH